LFEFMAAGRAINLVVFLGVLALVLVTVVQLRASFCQTKNMINLAVLAMNAVALAGVVVCYLFGQIMGAQYPYSRVGQAFISVSPPLGCTLQLTQRRDQFTSTRALYRARTLLESYAALVLHPIQRVCSLVIILGAYIYAYGVIPGLRIWCLECCR
jgi:hypothetical protein